MALHRSSFVAGDNLSAPRLNIQIDIPDGMEAAAYAALHKATEEIAQQLAALAGMPLSLTEGDTP